MCVTCEDNNIYLSDVPVQPEEPSEEEAVEVSTGDVNVDGFNAVLHGSVKGTNNIMECKAAFCYSKNKNDLEIGKSGVDSTAWNVIEGDLEKEVKFEAELKSLKENTEYYYRAVVKSEENYFYGEVKSFKTEEGYSEFVDLGLSVLWARCNVGANSPEESGGYYAWGETDEKETFNMDNYRFYRYHEPDDEHWTIWYEVLKYNDERFQTLSRGDDVASYNEGIRMPSEIEIKELVKDCQWTRDSINGVWGYRVMGPNGNSIFLPAVGNKQGTDILNAVSMGCYWSNTLYVEGGYYEPGYEAYALQFETGMVKDGNDNWGNMGRRTVKCTGRDRYIGMTVRAVKERLP